MVGIDRGVRFRDDAARHLAPIKAELHSSGVSIKNIIKGIYILVCETDQSTFETLFSTQLTSKTEFVPNLNGPGTNVTNWEASDPLVIPDNLKKLGVNLVEINRNIALTD